MKSWKRAAGNAILVSPHRFNEAGAMEPRKWYDWLSQNPSTLKWYISSVLSY